jgi:DNA-binding CsgD family transcriptional regulator
MDEDEICRRLDRLIRLVSIAATEGKNNRQQIEILGRVGFQPAEIADIIGTTPNTVRVEMSNMRKRKGKAGPKTEGA